MAQEIFGINQDKLSAAMCSMCIDIIDRVICPLTGLDGDNVCVIEPYLVPICELLFNAGCKKEDLKSISREILDQAEKRYGFKKGELCCFDGDTPIALLACYILEHGKVDAINAVIKGESND